MTTQPVQEVFNFSGIYLVRYSEEIYRGEWLYYVGQSLNVCGRVGGHLLDFWQRTPRAILLMNMEGPKDVSAASWGQRAFLQRRLIEQEARFMAAAVSLRLPLTNKATIGPDDLNSFGDLSKEISRIYAALEILGHPRPKVFEHALLGFESEVG
ncbi:MAG: hypothetical protein LAN36_11620 [Acidobacteriia bacterium]|nr:hypothetical protein [Terriglobia bacterium]